MNGIPKSCRPWPLYVRILIGVVLGAIVGGAWGAGAKPLGEIGMLVIRLLKALATPLILFAVLDAFLHTHIPARKGAKLITISLINAAVAVVIPLILPVDWIIRRGRAATNVISDMTVATILDRLEPAQDATKSTV